MRGRLIWCAAGAIVVGVTFVALASSNVQRAVQRAKFGDPIFFCIGDVGITLKRDWHITLLKRPDGKLPLVAGLFPAPVSMENENGSVAQVSLKSTKHAGEVSIHRTKEVGLREELLINCKTSQFCKPAVSPFDGTSHVVEISSAGTTWIKYLDKPIMIGLHGAIASGVEDITLGACGRN